jgi:RNA polymerase sigma-70 factor (ECF subfamily)
MNGPTDEELVRMIQEGDIIAFETLVRRYQQRLFAFVNRFVRSDRDSEEIVQDSLVKLYLNIGVVDVKKRLSTYLFGIAKNTAFSLLRQRNRTAIPFDDIAEIETDARIYERLLQKENIETVRKALSNIDPKYRKILKLYYFDDLSYEEISKFESLPVNTVRTRLKRAKEALKKTLAYEKY